MQIHRLQGYIQNIYLAEQAEGLLLLDGCSRADVRMVCDYITNTLGRPLSDLKLVVVTHMHPDHAGGAALLRKITGAPLAAHPAARHWYSGLAGRTAHAIDVGLTWWVAKRLGKPRRHIWYNPILSADILLQDEQRLPGFPDWQVLCTPGHTNHDLSLLHRPTGQLYVADLIVQVRGRLVPPYPVCHPNQYRQSLQRVAELQAQQIFCAHVPPQPAAAIDFASLLAQAPAKPKNHWHSARNRILHYLGRRDSAH